MDIDILKPNTGYVSIERPSQGTSPKTASDPQGSSGGLTPDDEHRSVYAEPVSEGEDDDDMAIAPAKDEHTRTGLTGEEVAEAIAFREKMLEERKISEGASNHRQGKKTGKAVSEPDDAEATDEHGPLLRQKSPTLVHNAHEKPRALSIDPLAPSSAFDKTFRERLRTAHQNREKDFVERDVGMKNGVQDGEGEGLENEGSTSNAPGDDRVLVRDWAAPSGKRIAVPVRVEPKVYFAAERTFLVGFCASIIRQPDWMNVFSSCRNGSTQLYSSGLLQRPCSTSFLPKILEVS